MFLVSTHSELQRTNKTDCSLSIWKQLLALSPFWFACSQDGFVTWLDKRLLLRQQGNQMAYVLASIFTNATIMKFRNGNGELHIFLPTKVYAHVGKIKRSP